MTIGNLVWLVEEGVVGEVVAIGAYFSQVKFFLNDVEHIEFIENQDLLPYELYTEE